VYYAYESISRIISDGIFFNLGKSSNDNISLIQLIGNDTCGKIVLQFFNNILFSPPVNSIFVKTAQTVYIIGWDNGLYVGWFIVKKYTLLTISILRH